MKVLSSACPECYRDGTGPAWRLVPLLKEQIYEIPCAKGHLYVAQYQHPEFDMLYTAGLNALVDGYYRDAVLGFMASLERFREFYCRGVFQKHRVNEDQVEAAWGPMKRSSERQFGLFVAAYLMENRISPKNIENAPLRNSSPKVKFQEFRNNVAHNGEFPKEQEAVDFGDVVCEHVFEIVSSPSFFSETGGQEFSPWYFMQLRRHRLLAEKIEKDPRFAHHRRIVQAGGTYLTGNLLKSPGDVRSQMAGVRMERGQRTGPGYDLNAAS